MGTSGFGIGRVICPSHLRSSSASFIASSHAHNYNNTEYHRPVTNLLWAIRICRDRIYQTNITGILTRRRQNGDTRCRPLQHAPRRIDSRGKHTGLHEGCLHADRIGVGRQGDSSLGSSWDRLGSGWAVIVELGFRERLNNLSRTIRVLIAVRDKHIELRTRGKELSVDQTASKLHECTPKLPCCMRVAFINVLSQFVRAYLMWLLSLIVRKILTAPRFVTDQAWPLHLLVKWTLQPG
jgi:hypothetical protein